MRRSRFLGTFIRASRAKARQFPRDLNPSYSQTTIPSHPTLPRSRDSPTLSPEPRDPARPRRAPLPSSFPRRRPRPPARTGKPCPPQPSTLQPFGFPPACVRCRASARRLFSCQPASGRSFSERPCRASASSSAAPPCGAPSSRAAWPFGRSFSPPFSCLPRSIPPVGRHPPEARIIQLGSCPGEAVRLPNPSASLDAARREIAMGPVSRSSRAPAAW
jgi:hypothetical protein